MIIRLFLILFLFGTPTFLGTSAFAQSRSFDCPTKGGISTNEASGLLSKVQEEYGKLKTLSASFHQDSYLSSLEVSELSTGTVSFEKPGRMRWDYKDPEPQVFTVKDNTLWLYQIAENQVVIDRFSDVLISDLPVSFLMGIGDLKKDFTISSSCKNPDGIVFNLHPKKSESPKNSDKGELQGLELLVSNSSYLPLGAKVTDVAGNITSIVLSKLSVNPALDGSLFETTFPKGTDISDRRTEGAG